jgi:hypothetical protein
MTSIILKSMILMKKKALAKQDKTFTHQVEQLIFLIEGIDYLLETIRAEVSLDKLHDKEQGGEAEVATHIPVLLLHKQM